jgi:hypothetical protein
MPVPNSSLDVDILPAEGFSYVLVDPGVFQDIDGFSIGKVLVLDLGEEDIDKECKGELSVDGNFRYF